jgi:hypothetical protein
MKGKERGGKKARGVWEWEGPGLYYSCSQVVDGEGALETKRRMEGESSQAAQRLAGSMEAFERAGG